MTFTELFKIILTADKGRSREAARKVRKFLYSSQNDGKSRDYLDIIDTAPDTYAKISEDWRQENFVIAVSVIYFLHNRENRSDFLFFWFFQLLQHKNGNIRHAAVRMIQHELGSLTYHIRFLDEKSKHLGLTNEQADNILFGLRANLNNLAENSWNDSYRKFKYINDLPSGTYKSVRLILSLLDDYCNDVANKTQIETKEQILERRKEIEQELVEMLKEAKSDFGLDDIKEIIYNENGQESLTDIIAMLDAGQSAAELQNVLEIINDAWNYFPHKLLGGISPAEKLLEHRRNHA